jgi:hypothetical protein
MTGLLGKLHIDSNRPSVKYAVWILMKTCRAGATIL